jgi:hypothetical protein
MEVEMMELDPLWIYQKDIHRMRDEMYAWIAQRFPTFHAMDIPFIRQFFSTCIVIPFEEHNRHTTLRNLQNYHQLSNTTVFFSLHIIGRSHGNIILCMRVE